MITTSLGVFGAAALLIAGVVFSVVTTILVKLGGDEVSGWLPVWSYRLLESAVSQVAPEYRDRYREEWRGELAAFRDRKLFGLRFAWRLRRKAKSVSAALAEQDSLENVFESEPVAPTRAPLDAETIAAIVRRAVERSRPRDQRRFEEIVEEMREILGEIDMGEVAAALTGTYVGDISSMRRAARKRPSLPAMRPPRPLPAVRDRPVASRPTGLDRGVDWGWDYDADWRFVPSDGDRGFPDAGPRRESTSEVIGRTIRSWCRGEIRL